MLVKLLLLRLRGGVRQRLRELKTLRGLLFMSLTMFIVVLLMKQLALTTNPLASIFSEEAEQRGRQITQFMPLSLLAAYLLTVFTAPSPALSFSPSEINLLFSGPFTRRALLLYKMSFYTFGVFLSSLFIMLLVPTINYMSASAFLSVFLSLLFIQLLTVVTDLLGQWFGRHVKIRIRSSYVFLTLILLFILIGWYYSAPFTGLTDAIARFQSSIIGTLLLAPFDVFVHIFLAHSFFPELLQWTLLGMTMNFVLLITVILLDSHSCEASTTASLELHQRRERARRRGMPWGAQVVKVRSAKRCPVLGGIGPLTWRQLLVSWRNASKALLVYLSLAILAGPLLVTASEEMSKWSLLMAVFFVAVFMLPRTLLFDFRSDLDVMENFKALPLPAWKISIGQLTSMVLLSSLIELVLLASMAIFLDSKWYILLVSIGFFLFPFNLLLYGLENLFFLLFPAPLVPVGRVDFDFLGRTLVGFSLTSALLVGSCLLAAITGQKFAHALDWQGPALIVVAWCLLTLIALLTLPLLSWAFNHFNVSHSSQNSQ